MKRSRHSKNFFESFWQGLLYWLRRLLRSFVNGLRKIFGANVQREASGRSLQSTGFQDDHLDYRNNHLANETLVVNRPKPFLFGLEDLPNLDVLTTKELIAQINWHVESSEIQTAKEEDLTLLEDLLINFPDA